MNKQTGEIRDPRLGRLMSKVTRRIIGFVLLTFTIGLTTCSVLDTVKVTDAVTVSQVVHS